MHCGDMVLFHLVVNTTWLTAAPGKYTNVISQNQMTLTDRKRDSVLLNNQ